MPLYKLDILRAVVELGGVGAAAEHLMVTQPVVTAHIRSLESSLGVTVFRRVGRRLELTDPGRLVYEWAKESDVRARQLERQLGSLSDGQPSTVAVSAGMSVGSYRLPEVMAELVVMQPHIRLTLDVQGPDEVVDSVVSGRSDFGVLIADEIARDERIHYREVGSEELVIVGIPGLFGAETMLTLAVLRTLPFVSTPRAHMRRTVEERHLHHIGVDERTVVIELGHPEAMRTVLRHGLGVALMFRCAVERDLADGTLVEYRIAGLSMSEPIHFLTRRKTTLTGMQRRAYDYFASAFNSEY